MCLISDNSIHVHTTRNIILAVYVDDLLIFAKDVHSVDDLFKDLRSKDLDITNLGPITEFLGIEIIRDRSNKSLYLSQEGYITRLLERYNNTTLKPIAKPYIEGRLLQRNESIASKEDICQF